MRRLWNLVPVALVLLAWLLSAGVVKLMEVPKPMAPPVHHEEPEAAAASPGERSLLRPDVRPELPSMLSTSILDHEISGPPEENRTHKSELPNEPLPGLPIPLEPLPMEPIDALPDEPTELAPVPEPGSAILLGAGLAWLAARRRGYSTESSSTSKVSTAPGGIAPGTPPSP